VSEFEVEVAFATPDKQLLLTVTVPAGATVSDVVAGSSILEAFPGQGPAKLSFGIWGKEVSGDERVSAGDRIEIYRPLKLDPREARRQLALSGRTMGSAGSG
jgi:putative ubiquitin-RnfH superfamily antitoxin RatB of RatAB toxin-antitoxin module